MADDLEQKGLAKVLSTFVETIQNTLNTRIDQVCKSLDKLDDNIHSLKSENEKINKEKLELVNTVVKLEGAIHHPPCDVMLEHMRRHSAEEHNRQEINLIRKKFIANVLTIVVASLIIGTLGSIWFAFANGYDPIGK